MLEMAVAIGSIVVGLWRIVEMHLKRKRAGRILVRLGFNKSQKFYLFFMAAFFASFAIYLMPSWIALMALAPLVLFSVSIRPLAFGENGFTPGGDFFPWDAISEWRWTGEDASMLRFVINRDGRSNAVE